MAISLSSIEPRGKLRLRLGFTNTLSAYAFVSASYYSVICTDGAGPSPKVIAAFIVPSSASTVEIALSDELVDGGAYSVSAIGVPASDGSLTPIGSALALRMGEARLRPTQGPQLQDALASFYGEDLVWNGDLVEAPDGDLAICSGTQVVEAQLFAKVEAHSLPWDLDWGAKLRKFVDGSPNSLPEAVGIVVKSVVKDDRVERAEGEIVDGEIQLTAQLVGGQMTKISSPIKV